MLKIKKIISIPVITVMLLISTNASSTNFNFHKMSLAINGTKDFLSYIAYYKKTTIGEICAITNNSKFSGQDKYVNLACDGKYYHDFFHNGLDNEVVFGGEPNHHQKCIKDVRDLLVMACGDKFGKIKPYIPLN